MLEGVLIACSIIGFYFDWSGAGATFSRFMYEFNYMTSNAVELRVSFHAMEM